MKQAALTAKNMMGLTGRRQARMRRNPRPAAETAGFAQTLGQIMQKGRQTAQTAATAPVASLVPVRPAMAPTTAVPGDLPAFAALKQPQALAKEPLLTPQGSRRTRVPGREQVKTMDSGQGIPDGNSRAGQRGAAVLAGLEASGKEVARTRTLEKRLAAVRDFRSQVRQAELKEADAGQKARADASVESLSAGRKALLNYLDGLERSLIQNLAGKESSASPAPAEAAGLTLRRLTTPQQAAPSGSQAALALALAGQAPQETRAAQAAGPAARPLPSQVAEFVFQVAEQVRWQAGEGLQTLSLRIKPAELGTLSIQVTRDGDGAVSARILAQSVEVQRLLESQLPLLQQSLTDSGLQVKGLEVALHEAGQDGGGPVGEHSGRQAGQQFHGRQQQAGTAMDGSDRQEADIRDGRFWAELAERYGLEVPRLDLMG